MTNPTEDRSPGFPRSESGSSPKQASSPIQLPKGGGAIRGIGEKFAANPVTGTGAMSIPLPLSPGRSGFAPSLALSYDSGSGNGPFGFGWSLSLPSISHRTDKGLPRYHETGDAPDVYVFSGAEDLVPVLIEDAQGNWRTQPDLARRIGGADYLVRCYRPRIEGLFARIERFSNTQDEGEVFWRAITRDNITSWFGRTAASRISDPADARRIFSWLICQSHDDKGNVIQYGYKAENSTRIFENALGQDAPRACERNRSPLLRAAQRYLKRVRYGNIKPYFPTLTPDAPWPEPLGVDATDASADWHFEAVFDYGEHDAAQPSPGDGGLWPTRPDVFSTYRAGFEVRSYRLCQRVMMFHHFKQEANVGTDCLVRALNFDYGLKEDPATSVKPVYRFLRAVNQSGYQRNSGGFSRKDLPPVEFTYSQPQLQSLIEAVDTLSIENFPSGFDGVSQRWLDLHGEGVPGLLFAQANAWYYKRNLSPLAIQKADGQLETRARFGPQEVVHTLPNAQLGGLTEFMDLAGDGKLDLVVLDGHVQGFYEHDEAEGWGPFRPFVSRLNIDQSDPNQRLVDLNGDGHADILITEDNAFVWHASLAEEGFSAARRVALALDEEQGPRAIFADGTETIHLADMSGDGLADLVRVRNGEVCYWPNLGYGRFGAKVTMDQSPIFDAPDQFNPSRLRLADIDGSGTVDIIYLHREDVRIFFNQSGNGWSAVNKLPAFPGTDEARNITICDLLGNGTACLVWSSPLAQDVAVPMRYVNLMGSVKPHLLVGTINNMGGETRVSYTPSTKFYLEDKRAGRPWVTRMPFPVHVVERVEAIDHISRHRLVSRYSYHHGHYDGVEREFRGFGRVEQEDCESFSDHRKAVTAMNGTQDVTLELNQPPVLTRSWYHTGAFTGAPQILHQNHSDYYRGEFFLPEPTLPAGLSDAEMREALRALKGLPLRQEVYSFDGSDKQQHPYSSTENCFEVRRIQPKSDQRHGVFFAVGRETLSINTERNPVDQRITQSLSLEVDRYGNPTKSCTVVHGRKQADTALPVEVQRDQKKSWISYAEADFTSDIGLGMASDVYRLRASHDSRGYEITGLAPGGRLFQLEELKAKIAACVPIGYDVIADGVTAQKRLIAQSRGLFLDNNLAPMPFGQWDSLGLSHQNYALAFTPAIVATHYAGKLNQADFSAAGYVHFDGDANWWIPSGTTVYPANPRARFYIPLGSKDIFGLETEVTHDDYLLLTTRVALKQAAWNSMSAVNDYRVMQPVLVTDANGNRSAVAHDELGMVTASAVMGKVGSTDGDTLEDPTCRITYDIFNWKNNRKTNFSHSFAREKHGAANPRWQESFSYSNGSGGVALVKVQAHPGKALRANADGTTTEVDANPRWIGNGRTVLNNKGLPVKQFEPYFSTTHDYEDDSALREIGVTAVQYYDPLGRGIKTEFPDGTLARAVFDCWKQVAYDPNDTVNESRWYRDRGSPNPTLEAEPLNDPARRAAWLATKHAGTPAIVHLDSLARPIHAVADYGGGKTATTRSESDLTGRFSKVFDQLGRLVAESFVSFGGIPVTGESAEGGRRWTFHDAQGGLVKSWDSRGRVFRVAKDDLRRPIGTFAQDAGRAEMLLGYVVFGDRLGEAAARQRNLLGTAHLMFDQSGMVRVPELDFKAAPVSVERMLVKDYKNSIDWSSLLNQPSVEAIVQAAGPALETGEVFSAKATLDALGRPISATLPDRTEILSAYNEANFLTSLKAKIRGAGPFVEFLKGQDYDAKGHRIFARYGNDVITRYFYDPKNFRLINLVTAKSGADPATQALQDLRYTFDAAGNITEISDAAQQTHFFNNAVVEPESRFEYDALYQLVRASGRELAGGANDAQRTEGDLAGVALPHPNNAAAVRNYTQNYQYDLLGNITLFQHQFAAQPGIGSGWTRRYRYAHEADAANRTNRLLSSSRAGEAAGGPFTDTYDHDVYGNMTRMPHLAVMDWNVLSQLRRVDLGGGGEAFYVYGMGGQRMRKVIERNGNLTLEWIYLGPVMIHRRRRKATNELRFERATVHITDNSGHIAQVDTKTRDDDGEDPANALNQPVIRYQYANHLGSAVLETDDLGNPISYEEYHPFGTSAYRSSKAGTDHSLKRFRFSGKERDDETGLIYFGARYYSAWLGRWTSVDPSGYSDSFNLFKYCRNSPVLRHDPTGMTSVDPNDITVVEKRYFTGQERWDELSQITPPEGWELNADITADNYQDYYIPGEAKGGAGGTWAILVPNMSFEPALPEPPPLPEPTPSAPPSEEQSPPQSSSGWNRVVGAIQLAGGVLEAVMAAGLLLAPEPTMVTKVGGVVLAAHSLDTIVAGARTLWTGEVQHTLTHQAGAGAARLAGASERTQHWVGTGADIAASLGPAAAVGISRRLAVSSAEFMAQGAKSSTMEVLQGAGVRVATYEPAGQVIGQMTAETCVAGGCRMIASDVGVMLTEETVAAALETTAGGANVLRSAQVLEELGVAGGKAFPNATLAELEAGLASGRSAMVGVQIPE